MEAEVGECPVCCENYEPELHRAYRAMCSHAFCEPCLRRLGRESYGCPICRAPVNIEEAVRAPELDCTAKEPEPDTGCTDRLVVMGFSPEEALQASDAAGGDIERALQHLLDPELASSPAGALMELPPGPVMNGTRVSIHGLKSRSDLNSRVGTVVEYVPDKERYRVTLGDEVVAVKRNNLRAALGGVQNSSELKTSAKRRGNEAFNRGDYDLAIREFTNSINQDSGDFVLYSNRSAAHACNRNYMAALKDAQQCVTLNPEFAKGHGRLAVANHCIGNFPGAIKAYKQGLALDPNNKILQQGLSKAEKRQAHEMAQPRQPGHQQRATVTARNTTATAPRSEPPQNTRPAAPQNAEPEDPFEAFLSDPGGAAKQFFQNFGSSDPIPANNPKDHSTANSQPRSHQCRGNASYNARHNTGSTGSWKRKHDQDEDCRLC